MADPVEEALKYKKRLDAVRAMSGAVTDDSVSPAAVPTAQPQPVVPEPGPTSLVDKAKKDIAGSAGRTQDIIDEALSGVKKKKPGE